MSRKAPEILEAAAGHILSRGQARDQPAGERSMARTIAAFNAWTGPSSASATAGCSWSPSKAPAPAHRAAPSTPTTTKTAPPTSRSLAKPQQISAARSAAGCASCSTPMARIAAAVVKFAHARGQLGHAVIGSCPSYLWAVADIAYLCRLRGIEVVTLTEGAADKEGIRTNRRKGSRDNIVTWTPRLRTAWDSLIARRDEIWTRKSSPIPIRADQRPLVVSIDGARLGKSSLDSAWQRLMALAIEANIITADQRYGLHDLKRRGITDTAGTRADKQEASGHRSANMMDTYDLSVPVVPAAGE